MRIQRYNICSRWNHKQVTNLAFVELFLLILFLLIVFAQVQVSPLVKVITQQFFESLTPALLQIIHTQTAVTVRNAAHTHTRRDFKDKAIPSSQMLVNVTHAIKKWPITFQYANLAMILNAYSISECQQDFQNTLPIITTGQMCVGLTCGRLWSRFWAGTAVSSPAPSLSRAETLPPHPAHPESGRHTSGSRRTALRTPREHRSGLCLHMNLRRSQQNTSEQNKTTE